MALTRGSFQRFDYDRMIVLFTMTDAAAEVACAISSAAMDGLEGKTGVKPAQREEQFLNSAIALKSARRINSPMLSLRDILQASFSAVSIFAENCCFIGNACSALRCAAVTVFANAPALR